MKQIDLEIMNKYSSIRQLNEAMITVLNLDINADDKSEFIRRAASVVDKIREDITQLWEERLTNEFNQ